MGTDRRSIACFLYPITFNQNGLVFVEASVARIEETSTLDEHKRLHRALT
jgi:hypothetical protein